jgi:hypothetical protein
MSDEALFRSWDRWYVSSNITTRLIPGIEGYPEIIVTVRVGRKAKSPLRRLLLSCLACSRSLRRIHCTRCVQHAFVFCEFKIDVSITNATTCEVRSVIRFLNAKRQAEAEIHRHIVSVYGDVMNRQNVLKWCREFHAGRTSFMMNQGLVGSL